MAEITDNELLELNSKGIVPGPSEIAEEYIDRARYCLSLKENLVSELNDKVPFKTEDLSAGDILDKPLEIIKIAFDISPDWVPVFFSNHKLGLWHGGCAWIFQLAKKVPLGAFLQLRRSFRGNKQFLFLYKRDEIISHELSHVGRMRFEEPKFEEFFAYKTSTSGFRRFFGPIVQSSKESLMFVFLLVFLLFADLGLLAVGDLYAFEKMMLLNLIPVFFVFLGTLRLLRRRHQLSKCIFKLKHFSNKAEYVAYRLTDKEIIDFAKMPEKAIKDYIETEHSLRWRLIRKAYLTDCFQ